ncbi:MAG: Wzz/FepE/Etk N-terminal domain-containing protein [Nitratireductor sp.]
MNSNRALTADVDIDVAGLMAEVWKKKWLVALLTIASAIGLLFVLSSVSPRYKSNAKIVIEKRESVFTRRSDGDYTLSGNQFDEQAINSQVQILNSDDIALKVIAELKLADARDFSDSKPSLMGSLLGAFGMGNAALNLTPDERILKSFKERLQVYSVDKSRVIVVEFWAKDPQLSYKVPNAVVDAYLEFSKQSNYAANEEATQWLGPEIDELRKKVREAEGKVADFRTNADIMIGNNNALLATQQLSEVSSELSRLRADRSNAEAKIATVRAVLERGASVDVIPEVIASPLIQRLRERQVQLRAEISELSTTLLPNHPRLKALQSQVSDFEGQIRIETRNILRSLETNLELTRKQEAALVADLNRLKAESSRVGEAEVGLRALEREANAQRELLETYLTRYREAASRQSREYLPIDARVISRAIPPSESFFPKVIPFTVAGSLAVLILTVVGILGWALMSGKAFKPMRYVGEEMMPEQVEPMARDTREFGNAEIVAQVGQQQPRQHSSHGSAGMRMAAKPAAAGKAHVEVYQDEVPQGMPSIDMMVGSGLPASTLASPPHAANDPDTFAFSEAFDALVQMGNVRLAVVSPAGDPGSVVAWNLARRLSRAGRSVAIVDLTGTAVTSSEFLGDKAHAGLKELVGGTVSFRQAIHMDRQSDVHVLPVGVVESGKFSISRLSEICSAMADNYDCLILDCGYTSAEGLNAIADDETMVIISREGSDRAEAGQFAADFRAAGFHDTICIRMDAPSPKATAAA